MASSKVEWTPVLADADLPEAKATRGTLDGEEILLCRAGDQLFAVGNRCPHQGAPLHRGIVKASGSPVTVTCPAHGSMFQLTDGRVLRGPAASPIPVYDARVNGGMIEVRRRD